MLPPARTNLQDKIQELQSALFYNLSVSVLKLPTTVITSLEVDEVGQIWFFINRPVQRIQEFDREFPVRMLFFKKGKSFYITLSGKACMVIDPEEVNGIMTLSDTIRAKADGRRVLVKVKVSEAVYFQTQQDSRKWFEGIKSQFSKWMNRPEHPYHSYQYV